MSTGHNLKTPLDGTEIIPFVVENGGSKATTAQDIADLGGGGGGVTDHGALTGLGDDDHTQYLTEARHDALPSDNPHNVTAAQTGAETSAQLDVRDTANRDRANHTGTQTASTISDFDTEVSNNPDVVANTAKVSFPGFTSLLADYGFTDNSANWDAAFSWGDHSLLGYLTDAPSDGTTYGRLNGAWAAISSGGSSLWSESGSDIYYNAGNVGIGLSDPDEDLEVNGNIKLSSSLPYIRFNGNNTAAVFDIKHNNSTKLEFYYNGNRLSYFTPIGTTGQFAFKQYSAGATADNYPAFSFDGDQDTGMGLYGADQLFLTTGGSTRLLANNTGVGIGTTNPIYMLHVASGWIANTTQGIRVKNGDNLTPTYGFVDDGDLGMYRVTTNTLGFAGGAGTNMEIGPSDIKLNNYPNTRDDAVSPVNFLSTDASGNILSLPTDSMPSVWVRDGSDIYYDSGNVGIGTTTPSEKLDVQGNTVLGGDVTFEGAIITHTSTSAAGNYTVLLTDHTIWKTGITGGLGGGDTVTLPSGAANGQEFLIVDTSGTAGTNFISLATAGSELINGSATMAGAIRDDYGYIKLKFDGTNYFVIAK